MNVTVVNSTDGTIHVHAKGCRDLRNQSRYGIMQVNGQWSYEAASRNEIALDSYADQIDEGSMTEEMARDEHQFFPCVTIS